MIARPLAPTAVPPEGVTLRPQPGNGVLVTYNPAQGFSFSAAASASPFDHPFRASLSGFDVRLRDGRVSGLLPRIGEQPMTEVALGLRGVAPVNGETWVCVEATPNANGFLQTTADQPAALFVVHRNSPFTQTADTGRQPLVLIVWSGNRPAALVQHTFFNLKYRRVDRSTRIDHEFL